MDVNILQWGDLSTTKKLRAEIITLFLPFSQTITSCKNCKVVLGGMTFTHVFVGHRTLFVVIWMKNQITILWCPVSLWGCDHQSVGRSHFFFLKYTFLDGAHTSTDTLVGFDIFIVLFCMPSRSVQSAPCYVSTADGQNMRSVCGSHLDLLFSLILLHSLNFTKNSFLTEPDFLQSCLQQMSCCPGQLLHLLKL